MALGLIGHFCIKIIESNNKDTENATLLKKYTNIILDKCMKEAKLVRSKVIMHDTANTDHKNKMKLEKVSSSQTETKILDQKKSN